MQFAICTWRAMAAKVRADAAAWEVGGIPQRRLGIPSSLLLGRSDR